VRPRRDTGDDGTQVRCPVASGGPRSVRRGHDDVSQKVGVRYRWRLCSPRPARARSVESATTTPTSIVPVRRDQPTTRRDVCRYHAGNRAPTGGGGRASAVLRVVPARSPADSHTSTFGSHPGSNEDRRLCTGRRRGHRLPLPVVVVELRFIGRQPSCAAETENHASWTDNVMSVIGCTRGRRGVRTRRPHPALGCRRCALSAAFTDEHFRMDQSGARPGPRYSGAAEPRIAMRS
jgi:hypothetical protein